MSDAALVRARARLYALLGGLIADGPSARMRAAAEAVPGLAALFPERGFDPELAAAAHHAAIHHEQPALGSAMLGADGAAGGPIADAARGWFAEGGFAPGRSDLAPDHAALALAYLGHLCAAEADADEDGATAAVDRVRGLAAGFLDGQLLRWLPAWAAGAAPQGDPWATVAAMAVELAVAHRDALGPAEHGAGAGWSLPDRALDLADPSTGLADIGRMLACPARSGWTAGRSVLDRICVAADVPSGVGDRTGLAIRALRTAAELDRWCPLLDAVDDALCAHDAALARFGAVGAPVAPWRVRLGETRALVDALRQAAPRSPQ